MIAFLSDLWHNSSDVVFWSAALFGTTLFLIRMTMTFIAGAFSVDTDHDSMDSLESYDENHHSGLSFKLFTLHSMSGFLMMFGWMGLASKHQLGMSAPYTLLTAFLCGFGMIIITALIMKVAILAESRGTVFSSAKTVGLTATVYQRIPAKGQGKIQVIVDNVIRELLAQSHNHQDLESFTLVKIVKAIDHEVVEVIEVKES